MYSLMLNAHQNYPEIVVPVYFGLSTFLNDFDDHGFDFLSINLGVLDRRPFVMGLI